MKWEVSRSSSEFMDQSLPWSGKGGACAMADHETSHGGCEIGYYLTGETDGFSAACLS
jgi:hypothetical protein